MLNLNSMMVGSDQPKVMADFYEKVLEKKPDMVDGDWYGFHCGSMFWGVGPHDKIHGKSKEADRIIINFETKEVEKEFARIKSLGATVVKEPYKMDPNQSMMIATFADPDGNLFQLMSPWEG